jgi:hypothetical protein
MGGGAPRVGWKHDAKNRRITAAKVKRTRIVLINLPTRNYTEAEY